MTEVSIKDVSNIIKEFKDVPYGGYLRKRFIHMPTDSYFCLEKQLAKCMVSNLRCWIRSQKMNT